MDKELKRKLKLRKKINRKRPSFRRYESWRYNRVYNTWRRPRGIDSHMRERKKGHIPLVGVGYRGPRAVRGLHPTGKEIVHIRNVDGLDGVDSSIHAVYVASTVGLRKRWLIQDRADELGITLLNNLSEGYDSTDDDFEEESEDEELDAEDEEIEDLEEE